MKGNMGYDQYTVPDSVAVEPTFVSVSFSTRKHTFMVAPAIDYNFWEGRTVDLKSPTLPFGIVACTLSDNLSRISCIRIHKYLTA